MAAILPYTIELITAADLDEVIDLLNTFFFQNEPMVKYLKLNQQHNLIVDTDAEFVQECAKCISENCSFKALNTNGRIIGITLNEIEKKNAPSELLQTSDETNYMKILFDFFVYVQSQYNVFDIHPEHDKILEAKFICVDDTYRGYGICSALTQRTIEYMKGNNIKLFLVKCSSLFSARMCERLGFSLDYTLRYKDYLVDGRNPILPAEPHEAFCCYTKVL